jgi:ribosomal protein S18 acetylase RimI-like enzyme
MDDIRVRRAGPADAEELTRLRAVMFEDMGRDPGLFDATWRQRNADHFATRLVDRERFAAFVIDSADGGLAAASVAWLEQHLIGAANPSGRVAYIANVSTDRAYRRRGYAVRTTTALLDWLRRTGVTTVDLHATPDAEHLYRSLGFTEPKDRALTLRLDS